MSLMLNDRDGNPSTTKTVFLYGCLVCIAKLALSKLNLGVVQIPEFGGSDFGMAIAALGSIYALDKHIVNLSNKEKEG